jgi:hypothetical protein
MENPTQAGRSKKKERAPEQVDGGFVALPYSVLDSEAWQHCSARAAALLIELARQHNGKNNGHLHLAVNWLKTRGWKSADQIQKGKRELLERRLVVKTYQGGLGIGPDLYALTWHKITNFLRLEISPQNYQKGLYLTYRTQDEPKHSRQSARRNEPVPGNGTKADSTVPQRGPKPPLLRVVPIPHNGNDVSCHMPLIKKPGRTVGKRGASGTKTRPDAVLNIRALKGR